MWRISLSFEVLVLEPFVKTEILRECNRLTSKLHQQNVALFTTPNIYPPPPLKSFRKQMDIIKINTQTHVCSQLCSQYSSFEQTVTWSTLMSLWHEHACERHMLTTVAKKQICFAFMLWMNYVTVLSIRTNFPTCPYRLNTYEQKNIQFFSQYL